MGEFRPVTVLPDPAPLLDWLGRALEDRRIAMGVSNPYLIGCRYYATVQDKIQGIRPHRRALFCREGMERAARAKAYALATDLKAGRYKPPLKAAKFEAFLTELERHYIHAAGPDRKASRERAWKSDEYRFGAMFGWFRKQGLTSLGDVTIKHVEAYRDWRMAEGKALATVKGDVRIARAAWNWAVKNEMVASNPWIGVTFPKEAKKNPRNLSQFEVRKVFAAALEIDYDLFARMAIALYAGLRLEETERLERASSGKDSYYLDWERSEINLGLGKDLEPRRTVFPDELKVILARYKGGIGPVLPYMPRSTVQHLVTKIAKAKEVPLSFHDLRRTFAGDLAVRGVPTSVIQGYLGHASVGTTEAYYVGRNTEVREKDKNLASYGIAPAGGVAKQKRDPVDVGPCDS